MRFTALDFETTGVVRGYPNEPWQLGVVDFENGVLLPETKREWFFDPGERPFSPHAVGRWAEMRETLRRSPRFEVCWPEIAERLTGRTLVAHNAATERTMLTKKAPFAPLGPWVDTLVLARAVYPKLSDYALGPLLTALGLAPEAQEECPDRTWHDALFDACAGAVLACHFMRTSALEVSSAWL